jgi:molybdopterin molybdotransferase
LVTIGGVSVGDYDLVRPALEASGFTIDFHKVNVKPGKPILFGRSASAAVLGLPGNPVSAQVMFLLFGMPLLHAMQGAAARSTPFRSATLTSALRQNPGRHGFVRATLQGDRVTPLSNQASGAVTSMAWANALVHVPASSAGFEAGARVSVLSFNDV